MILSELRTLLFSNQAFEAIEGFLIDKTGLSDKIKCIKQI